MCKSCIPDISFPRGHVFEELAIVYKSFLQADTIVSIANPFYHYRLCRKDAITETHTMANLFDYWLSHKSRYDYFLQDDWFNTDEEIINKVSYTRIPSFGTVKNDCCYYHRCEASVR